MYTSNTTAKIISVTGLLVHAPHDEKFLDFWKDCDTTITGKSVEQEIEISTTVIAYGSD
jgi:hypothetical protein